MLFSRQLIDVNNAADTKYVAEYLRKNDIKKTEIAERKPMIVKMKAIHELEIIRQAAEKK